MQTTPVGWPTALHVVGLVNIQFVIYDDKVYVIEVNPRSSRTIPYITKVTGVPIIELATRAMLGETAARIWAMAPGCIPRHDLCMP